MAEQTFSLIPFAHSNTPEIQITGHVIRKDQRLILQYTITGKTEKILLPERSLSPRRKDDLWTTTCFEFFLALPNDPQYWEFNISPSGDWNIYHMDAYRRVGFREETSIEGLPVEVRHEAGRILLKADVDLSRLIAERQALELGVACVVQGIDQHETFWALAHPGAAPDFHMRESFIIQL